jgi:hypothetical protein
MIWKEQKENIDSQFIAIKEFVSLESVHWCSFALLAILTYKQEKIL